MNAVFSNKYMSLKYSHHEYKTLGHIEAHNSILLSKNMLFCSESTYDLMYSLFLTNPHLPFEATDQRSGPKLLLIRRVARMLGHAR